MTQGRPIDAPTLTSMSNVITHRGPDSAGFHVEPGLVGLATRRLAIIDLIHGDQPLSNEDGTVWISYNGEVYNFKELRRVLEQRGHTFKTSTDTEAIVHAYEEYGVGCVKHLRGMFAFAVWDSRKRRLVLARDRVGIKQLFYTSRDGQLFWGSEIKCLLQIPGFERRLNPAGLQGYLNFLYVPAPMTLFDGVHELEPASVLVVEEGEVRSEKYWELEYQVNSRLTIEDAAAGLRERLDEAVCQHMVSDVPMGGFLSGGIDSATVVALMARHHEKPPVTFSIGYAEGGERFDERHYARQVAEQLRTVHHEFVMRPDIEELLPKLVRAFDQPVGDSSAIPNWYLCELTRRHVTVALSGLGGDELFAGYERYRGVVLANRARFLPRWLRRSFLQPVIEKLPDSRRGNHWNERLKRFMRTLDKDFDERYFDLISGLGPEWRSELLNPELVSEQQLAEPWQIFRRALDPAREADPLNRALFADLKLYLPGDLLTLTDRVSMAHSLEVRVPFLDHELLEYSATLPPQFKLRGLQTKHVLRRAVKDLLPKETMNRPKMGFSVPLTVWFRDVLRPFVEEVLSERSVTRTQVLRYPAVRRILDDHFACRRNHDNYIWALMTLMVWHQEYIAQPVGTTSLQGVHLAGGSTPARPTG